MFALTKVELMGVALLLLGRWRPGFSTCKEVDTLLYVKPPKNLINVTVELLFKRQCMLWAVPKLESVPTPSKTFLSLISVKIRGKILGDFSNQASLLSQTGSHRHLKSMNCVTKRLCTPRTHSHDARTLPHIFPANCNQIQKIEQEDSTALATWNSHQ